MGDCKSDTRDCKRERERERTPIYTVSLYLEAGTTSVLAIMNERSGNCFTSASNGLLVPELPKAAVGTVAAAVDSAIGEKDSGAAAAADAAVCLLFSAARLSPSASRPASACGLGTVVGSGTEVALASCEKKVSISLGGLRSVVGRLACLLASEARNESKSKAPDGAMAAFVVVLVVLGCAAEWPVGRSINDPEENKSSPVWLSC